MAAITVFLLQLGFWNRIMLVEVITTKVYGRHHYKSLWLRHEIMDCYGVLFAP